MPAKRVKTNSGRHVEIKAVRLENGNLLTVARMPHDRNIAAWVEVEPGTKDYERWLPVACDHPDPREEPDYQAWWAEIVASPSYQAWLAGQESE
jgi:hypothetical protein